MSTVVEQAIADLPVPGGWRWDVVVRPRRRTLGIEIAEDGRVLFAIPADADPQEIADAVRGRMPRLAAEVRRRQDLWAAEPVRDLIGGEGFAYLGRRYRLKLTPDGAGRHVRLRQGWLELPRSRSAAADAGPLVEWYGSRGERWLAARLPPLASLAGVRAPAGIEVRDLGRRWGVCSPEGAITVHWAVVQLPVALVDLVLIHELCHLKHPGHGAAFRGAVRLALPDADVRERRFAQEEPRLWRGAVSATSRGLV
ncbi:M48 family metallopeptidase [Streptomyces sp. KMM 9044]|uniref:M48 family metallopeptidase n=1 Tax=Streptomyces sp. KMM 9044 TaxID=2744474 RepID=UPI002151C3A0|nr:M48 family metallopeptidase [Streptomyces sp. KMM 9044]WAX77795.1 M48 family metallopeptidase [Streptomyces sp. KMM 9044]